VKRSFSAIHSVFMAFALVLELHGHVQNNLVTLAPRASQTAIAASKFSLPPAGNEIPVALLLNEDATTIDFADPSEVSEDVRLASEPGSPSPFQPYTVAESKNPIHTSAGSPSAQQNVVDNVNHYVWDLSPLYGSQAAWQAERNLILTKIATFASWKGKVGNDAQSLAQAMDDAADLRRRAAKMAVYGILVSMEDIHSENAQSEHNVGIMLETQVEGAVSFVDDEVRNLGQLQLDQYMRGEPRLEAHRRRIHQIMHDAPHRLSSDAQSVLNSLGGWPQVSWDTYWALTESDLGWQDIQGPEGEHILANRSSYLRLRGSPNQKLRRAVESAYLDRLKSLEIPFGILLTRRVEADLTIAEKQRFRDGMEAQLFREGMPAEAQGVMVQVAHDNLATLLRYMELRRRALGLPQFSYADVYVDPPGNARRFSVPESMDSFVASAAPLGSEFQTRMRGLLAAPWVHLPPWPNKRDEYGLWYPAGGVGPFGFMKYDGTFNSSNLLAGLAQLMVTYKSIPAEHPPDTRNDPGIYSNAILYAGMILQADYLTDHAADPQQRSIYLILALDRMAQTMFRHPMTVEFESAIQEQILKGAPPSGEQLSALYLALLKQYFGGGKSGMTIDDSFGTEWMSVRLPFGSFETINWPLAMASACTLVERVRAGDPAARKGFDGVLGRGESDLSYDLLKQAGVDLATPEPYNAAIRRMNKLLDQLQGLLQHPSLMSARSAMSR
jgi:oligoendopeptidase F